MRQPFLCSVFTAVVAALLTGCAAKRAPTATTEREQPLPEILPQQPAEQPTAEQQSPVLEGQVQPQPDYAYEPAGQPQVRVHTVKPGETLYAIARKYYNDGRQWRRIWQANRNRIKDPNRVPAGIKLIIP